MSDDSRKIRPSTPTMPFAPSRPSRGSDPTLRATVRASVEHVDHAVNQHERQRTRTDPQLATDHLARHEAERRASILARHERELEQHEGAVHGLGRHVDERLSAQDRALVVLFRELGIEDRLPPEIRQSVPPPPPGELVKPPKPKLTKIERDTRAGTNGTYAAIVLIVLQLLLEALRHGGH